MTLRGGWGLKRRKYNITGGDEVIYGWKGVKIWAE